jgi:D-alanine--poly(phosphoribitol) ligase subunit 2
VQKDQLTQVIRDLTSKALGREGINLEDDFFDLGASSLTIVELQIQLENVLGLTAPTSSLMSSPSTGLGRHLRRRGRRCRRSQCPRGAVGIPVA